MTTLPPALYWSPSLAEHLNTAHGEVDSHHGLVDATGPVLYAWTEDRWSVLPVMPEDARQLVLDLPRDTADIGYVHDDLCSVWTTAEKSCDCRVGPWVAADEAGTR